jgi:hypothetical protein
MPIGPGKYDDLCSEVRIKADARGVILFVIDGSKGSGFSCQADLATTLSLPDILERVAKDIRADIRAK